MNKSLANRIIRANIGRKVFLILREDDRGGRGVEGLMEEVVFAISFVAYCAGQTEGHFGLASHGEPVNDSPEDLLDTIGRLKYRNLGGGRVLAY